MPYRLKIPALVAGTLCLAFAGTPAAAQSFQPCADRDDFPALEGSLCASLQAKLTPGAGAEGGEVSLFVRKFPAPGERRGEVWMVAGGPGESGASFYPLLPVLRRTFPHHDLVIPDHRGTGYSSRLCEVEEAVESPDGMALAGDEWGPCIGAMYADLPRTHAFTITNAAHDLSALITQLGGEGETYLYGVSYGTQLVLRMMQAAPVALDGIILDGLISPETSPEADLSRRTEITDAVGRALLTPGEEAAYRALLAQDAPDWAEAVPGGDLRRFMGSLLNYPELRARIPDIIAALSRGETELLEETGAALAAEAESFGRFPQSPSSLPLVAVISGSENNSRRELTGETVEAEAQDALFVSPLPGLLAGNGMPLYERDGYFGGAPAHLPPALVLQGTRDPNTPYEGALAHLEMLSEAGDLRLTTVDGGAHFLAFAAPACFEAAAGAFVAGEVPPERCGE